MRPICRAAALVVVLSLGPGAASAADADTLFEAKVRPILTQHCVRCHGPEKQKGGLRLDSRAGWQAGGDSGPAVRPGKPDESLLVKAVRYADPKLQMPPGGQLAAHDVAALVEWVKV